MTKAKSGRPIKVDQTVVRKLEDALMYGATIVEACYLSGISRDTFYRHVQEDAEFSDKMERARNWLRIIAKRNIAEALRAGDVKVSLWVLERHDTLPRSGIVEEIPDVSSKENVQRYTEVIEAHIQNRVAEELEILNR